MVKIEICPVGGCGRDEVEVMSAELGSKIEDVRDRCIRISRREHNLEVNQQLGAGRRSHQFQLR